MTNPPGVKAAMELQAAAMRGAQEAIPPASKVRQWREANANLLATAKALTRLHAAYNGPEMDNLRYAIARVDAAK